MKSRIANYPTSQPNLPSIKNRTMKTSFFKISYYLFFVVVNFCHAIFDDLCLKKIHPILTQKNQSNPFRAIIPSSHILIPFDIHHVPLPVIVFP